MSVYQSDLSSLSEKERIRIYDVLDTFSFMSPQITQRPGVYIVYWDRNEPIEKVANIPAHLLTVLHL